jgi:hypothetical protein
MSFNHWTSFDNFVAMLPHNNPSGLCNTAQQAHFGPGVYGTTMGFGADPYQVAVNNWGKNAAASKVKAGNVDVCMNFTGLTGGMHYQSVGPDNRDVLLAPHAIDIGAAGAIVQGKGFGMYGESVS